MIVCRPQASGCVPGDQVSWNCGGGTLHVLSSIAGVITVYCGTYKWEERKTLTLQQPQQPRLAMGV